MKNAKFVLACLILSITGCAAKYQEVQAEKVYKEAPGESALVEEAMAFQEFHVLPQGVSAKIERITKSGYDASKTLDLSQKAVCAGPRALFKPSFKVRLVLPKAPEGANVSEVAENRKQFIYLSKVFLKRWFFASASNHDFKETFNGDFGDYKTHIRDGQRERKTITSFDAFVPAVYSNKRDELKSYYAGIRYLPTLPPLNHDPREWYPEKHLLVIVNPKDRSALLVPKVSALVKASWNDTRLSTTLDNSYIGELDSRNPASVHNLSLKAFYVPSEAKYKVNGAEVHPLKASYAEDIAYFKYGFSLVKPDGEYLDWDQALFANTIVQDAPQKDGDLSFVVQLDLNFFCSYGVAKTSVMAH